MMNKIKGAVYTEQTTEKNVEDFPFEFKDKIDSTANTIIANNEQKLDEISKSKSEQGRIIKLIQQKVDTYFNENSHAKEIAQYIFDRNEEEFKKALFEYFNDYSLTTLKKPNNKDKTFKEISDKLEAYLKSEECNYENQETKQYEYKIVLSNELSLTDYENVNQTDFQYHIGYNFKIGGQVIGKDNKNFIEIESDEYAKFEENVPKAQKHIEEEIVEKILKERWGKFKETMIPLYEDVLSKIEKEIQKFLDETN